MPKHDSLNKYDLSIFVLKKILLKTAKERGDLANR